MAALTAPYLRILRSPIYRFLWIGQVVSNFGDTLHYVALVVLLFKLTGSGTVLAALALAQIGVSLVIGPFAGLLVDRVDRRGLMIMTDLARAALAVALAFTTHAAWAVALAVAMTAVGVPFRPAAQALLPSLVDDSDLLAANTVGWSTEQGTQIVAAAIAGATLLTWGTTPAFLFNAATFVFSAVFSAVMLLRLPSRGTSDHGPSREESGGFWVEANAGLSFARRDAFVGPLVVIQGMAAGEIASIGLAGLLVDRVGFEAIYIVGGALLVGAGVLGLVIPGTRTLHIRPKREDVMQQ